MPDHPVRSHTHGSWGKPTKNLHNNSQHLVNCPTMAATHCMQALVDIAVTPNMVKSHGKSESAVGITTSNNQRLQATVGG